VTNEYCVQDCYWCDQVINKYSKHEFHLWSALQYKMNIITLRSGTPTAMTAAPQVKTPTHAILHTSLSLG